MLRSADSCGGWNLNSEQVFSLWSLGAAAWFGMAVRLGLVSLLVVLSSASGEDPDLGRCRRRRALWDLGGLLHPDHFKGNKVP